MDLDFLRVTFTEGLKRVSQITGIAIEKLPRDTYRAVCYKNNIKYVNPYILGGYRVARSQMLKDYNEIKNVTNPIATAEDATEISSSVETPQEETYNEDTFPTREAMQEEIKKYKRFVITTAVSKKQVNEDFLNSIKNYAKRNNAMLLVFPSDISNTTGNEDEKIIELDKRLKDFAVIYKDIYLNSNLCLCSIKTSAKQIKTLTGLERIATKKNASIIVGSTKLFEDNVPTKNGKVPLRILTTGAITENNYDTDKYMSKRTAYLAEEDHTFGAVVVEVVNNTFFHMRLVEGSVNNTFTDLGVEYKPDGSITVLKDNVAIFGDSHTELINEELHRELMKVIENLNADTVVLHDVFNGTSITHHDKGKALTRAIKANENRNSLAKEGQMLKNYLEDIKAHTRDIVIVKSNHDRHLETYLEEGRYITDPINTYLAHKLAIAYMEEKDPLQYLVEDIAGLNPKYVKWLALDESYNKYGVELSYHGSSGVAGSRGSLPQFEKALGNCVTAHTHSAKRIRRACCVGTVAKLAPEYTRGSLTCWSHTICLLHSNGTKQLIHFIRDEEGNYNYTIG